MSILDVSVLSNVIESARVGIVLIDRDSVVSIWNDWLAKRSGISQSDCLGRELEEVLGKTPERLAVAIEGALKFGMSSLLSHSLNGSPLPLHPEGDRSRPRIHQQIEIRPLRFPDNRRGCLIQVEDVSIEVHRAQLLLEKNEQLSQFSYVDLLTQLANRRRFDEALEEKFRVARRVQRVISVAMIDVDQFKQYNDALGHLEGDYCLRRVADQLREALRRGDDLVARYGGEEFALVMGDTNLEEASKIAQHVCDSVLGAALPHPRSIVSPHVTVSIGVASLIPMPGETPDDLIRLADGALYEAKRAGRNQVWAARRHVGPVKIHETVEAD